MPMRRWAAGERILHWRGQPDDQTQNFLELWIPHGAQGITIQLTPPGRAEFAACLLGRVGNMEFEWQAGLWTHLPDFRWPPGPRYLCPACARAHSFIQQICHPAPSGTWDVKITNTVSGQGHHRRIHRARRPDHWCAIGAKAIHFEDEWCETSGNLGSFVDHPSNPTPIRRSGRFSTTSQPVGKPFRSAASACPVRSGHGTRRAGRTRTHRGRNVQGRQNTCNKKPLAMKK